MADIVAVDSILNTSTVSGVALTSLIFPDPLVNQNVVSPVALKFNINPDSVVNTSTVSNIFDIRPGPVVAFLNSITNSSTVSSISFGEGISADPIENLSFVSDVSIPTFVDIAPSSLINVSSFGSVILKVQPTPVEIAPPANPIQRPKTSVSTSELILNGKVGNDNAVFKDLSMTFKAHPLTGDVVRVLNNASIEQAFKSIILTEKGERPFSNIDLGGDIRGRLFDLITPTTLRSIQEDIQREILNFESRVIILDVNAEAVNTSGIRVTITYKIKTLTATQSYSLFLERI